MKLEKGFIIFFIRKNNYLHIVDCNLQIVVIYYLVC